MSNPKIAADVLRSLIPFMLVKRGEAIAFCVLASIRGLPKIRGRRSHPEAEAKAVRIIATLKANGGTPSEASHQEALDLVATLEASGGVPSEALDLVVYLRKEIEERGLAC